MNCQMLKKEVIDLHSLLTLTANYYLETEYGEETAGDRSMRLDESVYSCLDLEDHLEPGEALSQIHRPIKREHRAAVFELAEALTADMDAEYEPVERKEVDDEESYFDRNPSAEEVVRELYEKGPAESLIGLSGRVDAAYSSVSSHVDYMVERGWLEDREEGNRRSVFLPGDETI